MGYTKAPVNDTHNVIRVSTTGTPFLTSGGGLVPTTCKVIDGFPLSEKQWGTDPKRSFHKRSGWLRRAVATGTVGTSNRLSPASVVSDDPSTPLVYFGKADKYYAFDLYTNSVSAALATHPTGNYAGQAAFTTFIDSTNARRVAALGYYSLQSWTDPAMGGVTTTDLSALTVLGEKGLVFINGYLFGVNETGQRIYNSNPGGVYSTWSSTDFLSAEQWGDPILWIEGHKNHLVAFGSRSIEFFYDGAVEIGSPLVRQESYATQIGLYTTPSVSMMGGRRTAKIGDDIYFLGVKTNDTVGLFRIRDFRVDEVGTPALNKSLNHSTTGVALASAYLGIQTIIQDNNPMVMISLSEARDIVYFPEEDTFVEFTVNTTLGYDIPDYNLRAGGWVWHKYTGVAAIIGQASLSDSTMYMWYPDINNSVSTSMVIYSDVVDNGINYSKHIARVDAVGDYNNNSLTLAYNPTPNYAGSYTSTYAINASTIGYGNNISWHNLGAFRRYSLKLTVTGNYGAIHEGFDVEYNVGAL